MKPVLLLHCAEPRLGGSPDLAPERAADRQAAFARVVSAAIAAGADALLVSGQLLEPGDPDPALLAAAISELERARGAGLTVATTCEGADAPWLDHLAARGVLSLLAYPSPAAAADALATVEPRPGLRIAGLGRPRRTELAARALQLARLSERGVATVALINAALVPAGASGGLALADLACLEHKATYAALGGATEPYQIGSHLADPGPLTRIDVASASAAEPSYVEVSIPRSRPALRTQAAGDRRLVEVELAASAGTSARALEETLRRRLEAVAEGERPLLRVRVSAPSDLALDEGRLLALARAAANPVELWLELRHEGDPGDRASLEHAALLRLLAGRDPAFLDLATEVLAALTQAPPRLDPAGAALRQHLEERPPRTAKRTATHARP